MTLHAQHRIGALAAVVVAAAILTCAALAQPDPSTAVALSKYGWGASATVAKAQKGRSETSRLSRADHLTPAQLAKYGWGAAATYAKAKARPVTSARASQVVSSTKAQLARHGWGAAATYAKGLGLRHRLGRVALARAQGRLAKRGADELEESFDPGADAA
jgi:hypothetical protein